MEPIILSAWHSNHDHDLNFIHKCEANDFDNKATEYLMDAKYNFSRGG